ncbi:hypothetical protein PCASD_08810 [Puccinia coronata f. sp. avenae]|uniref:Uncharacterized protein n=1 Tax=Puccinia coronata f. sp. avenae TaxID=200324 RepID=A0A2N5UPP0_9BASI|nr:hypothetical protein PCASD_08810 [Puccinia coronata f. sp. avenae]
MAVPRFGPAGNPIAESVFFCSFAWRVALAHPGLHDEAEAWSINRPDLEAQASQELTPDILMDVKAAVISYLQVVGKGLENCNMVKAVFISVMNIAHLRAIFRQFKEMRLA